MSVEQVMRKVYAPTGVPVKTVGTVDPTPFKQLQIQPGEQIGELIERLARPRGAILGSDHLGNQLLIGDHTASVIGTLVEGVNIKRMQATISVQDPFTEYILRGQTGASDDQNMAQAAQQECGVPGSAKRYSPLIVPSEQPVWSIAELCARARNEAKWHEGTIVNAAVTVQGWFVPGTSTLWTCGANVSVVAPMAMLDMVMKIRSLHFTQDRNAGTLTQLDLCAPWLLDDSGAYNVAKPGAPLPPEAIDPSAGEVTSEPITPPPETIPPPDQTGP
jgi:prophage tail gpP-like protein